MTKMAPYLDSQTLLAAEPLRIARLLSLRVEPSFDDIALASKVATGLPVKVVRSLTEIVGRQQEDLVAEATLRRTRKRRKPLGKQQSEVVFEMSLVIDLLARVYRGDLEKIRAFLDSPHSLLNGATPFEMARSSSAGARVVRQLIERADAGVAL